MTITPQLQSQFDKLPDRMGFAFEDHKFSTLRGIEQNFRGSSRGLEYKNPLLPIQNFAEIVNMLIELGYMNPQEAGVLGTDAPSSRNFSVGSAGWEEAQLGLLKNTPYQVFCNPQRDVFEFRVKGKEPVQFFKTREAALRETAKLRRRIPTDAQWENIIKSGWRPKEYPGCASWVNGKIFGVGTVGYFSSDSDNIFLFSEDEQEVKKLPDEFSSGNVRTYSVCCLKDTLL